MTEEETQNEIVETVEETEEPLSITAEELQAFKDARERQNQVNSMKRIVDLELDNLILKLYNKYKLTVGLDSILENGTIVKAPGEGE